MQKIKGDYRGLLGRRLRTLRKGKGLTQEKLGDYADIDYKFLGAVERGQQNPSIDTLAKIADALCVELPELFRFEHGMEGDRHAVEARERKSLRSRMNRYFPEQPVIRFIEKTSIRIH